MTDVTFTLGYFLHSPELFFALLACVPKIIIRCMVPEIWCAMDGRTDGRPGGRTEKVKEMGAPPNDCLRKTQQKDSS